jgi:hypothetical protein
MSYLPSKLGSAPALAGVGDVVSAADAAYRVVTDPCLGRVANLVLELNRLEQPSKPDGTPGPTPTVPGIGLCKAVKPLEAVVWVRKNPWSLPLAAGAIVGGIFLLGWSTGRGRR